MYKKGRKERLRNLKFDVGRRAGRPPSTMRINLNMTR